MALKIDQRPMRQNFGVCLQVPRKALLTKYGCGLVIATATGNSFGYLKLMKRPTRLKFGMRLPRNWVSITDYVCVSLGVDLVLATSIGHHYACQILIYGLIMQKFGIPSPSNWVSIINYMWVWQCGCGDVCGLVLATRTGSCFGYPKLIKGPTRPKLEWLL